MRATPSPVAVRFAQDSIARFGMIVLSTDLTVEQDAIAVMPAISTQLLVTRVQCDNPLTPENLARMLPRLSAAAELIAPEVPLEAICYACTSASAHIGDEAVTGAIQSVRPKIAVVTPSNAAVAGFKALGVRRVSVLTPYTVETTQPLLRYFERCGLQIVQSHCLGLDDDRDIARVSQDTVIEAAAAADHADADAVFLSCTALPAMPLIERLEERLSKPVVTSNQACLWRMLTLAGLQPTGPGRLFKRL